MLPDERWVNHDGGGRRYRWMVRRRVMCEVLGREEEELWQEEVVSHESGGRQAGKRGREAAAACIRHCSSMSQVDGQSGKALLVLCTSVQTKAGQVRTG